MDEVGELNPLVVDELKPVILESAGSVVRLGPPALFAGIGENARSANGTRD